MAIEPGGIRLEINLTPGVAVADKVLSLIDKDRDGVISPGEARAYAEALRRDLVVQLDQTGAGLKLAASNFPALADLRTGLGIIQMEFFVTTGPLAPGAHKLTLLNRHLPALSVYLFNAAIPRSASIRIVKQMRNDNQSLGKSSSTSRGIEFFQKDFARAPQIATSQNGMNFTSSARSAHHAVATTTISAEPSRSSGS